MSNKNRALTLNDLYKTLHEEEEVTYINYWKDLDKSLIDEYIQSHEIYTECASECISCQITHIDKYKNLYPDSPEISYRRYIANGSKGQHTHAWQIQCPFIPKSYDDNIPVLFRDTLDPDQKEYIKMLNDPVLFAAKHFKWYARKHQELMLRCQSKRKVLRWGRRAGKSEAFAIEILWHALTKNVTVTDPETGEKVTTGIKILIVAPFESQVINLFEMINGFINRSDEVAKSVVKYRKSPHHHLEFSNGCTIKGFTTGANDAASIRGQDAHILILDECDYMSEGDYKTVMPIAQSHPNVLVRASSTPKGKRERFWTWSTHNPQWKEFYFPSAVIDETPVSQTNMRWKDMRREMRPEYSHDEWLQEVMAIFIANQMGVYQPTFVAEAMADYKYSDYRNAKVNNSPDLAAWRYTIGVDWNSTVGTEICVLGYNPSDGFRVMDMVNVPKQDFTQFKGLTRLTEMFSLWKPEYVYVDAGHGACVDSETWIHTEAGLKRLKDLVLGDMVLTVDGNYKKVLSIVDSPIKDSYEVTPYKCPSVKTSFCHPFYVYRSKDRFNDSKEDIEEKLEWLQAEDIDPIKDFLAIPKQNIEYRKPEEGKLFDLTTIIDMEGLSYDDKHIWNEKAHSSQKNGKTALAVAGETSTSTIDRIRKNLKLKKDLTVGQSKVNEKLTKLYGATWWESEPIKYDRYMCLESEDFMSALGWYLSEGSCNKKARQVEISQKKYMSEFDDLVTYMDSIFRSGVNVTWSKKKVCRLIISGDIPFRLFSTLGGVGSQNKRIHKIYNGLYLKPLLHSLFLGDGTVNRDESFLSISLTSYNLVNQIRQYFIDHNILGSWYELSPRQEGHMPQSRIDIKGSSDVVDLITELTGFEMLNKERVNREKYITTNKYILVPIREYKKIGNIDTLMDIEVEDDHSFVGNGIILHNTNWEMLVLWAGKQLPGTYEKSLEKRIKKYDFGSKVEIREPLTKKLVKHPAKAFMVENSVRKFEDRMIKFSKDDEKLMKQLLNYIVKSRSESGKPNYDMENQKIGDHALDALNLALLAWTLEEGMMSPIIKNHSTRVGVVGDPRHKAVEENARPELGDTTGASVFKLVAERNKSIRSRNDKIYQEDESLFDKNAYRNGFLDDTEYIYEAKKEAKYNSRVGQIRRKRSNWKSRSEI